MGKTKISWCDEVFNPVYGCLNKCPYCYARKMAKRVGERMAEKQIKINQSLLPFKDEFIKGVKNFEPAWMESNFRKGFSGEGKRIFVNSMSDIFFWRRAWMEKVLNKIKENPQHTFLFLTKYPSIYSRYKFPENCWLGFSVSNQRDINKHLKFYSSAIFKMLDKRNKIFLSIEPLHEEIDELPEFDWVIIGAETGNRKGKPVPSFIWIQRILNWGEKYSIPIFLKENIKPYLANYQSFKQEFPK